MQMEISYRISWRRSYSNRHHCDSGDVANGHLLMVKVVSNVNMDAEELSFTCPMCAQALVFKIRTTGLTENESLIMIFHLLLDKK